MDLRTGFFHGLFDSINDACDGPTGKPPRKDRTPILTLSQYSPSWALTVAEGKTRPYLKDRVKPAAMHDPSTCLLGFGLIFMNHFSIHWASPVKSQ